MTGRFSSDSTKARPIVATQRPGSGSSATARSQSSWTPTHAASMHAR